MSHSASNNAFTPPKRSLHTNPYTSPLNALSNQSAFSANTILTNKLIPRDYLTSRSKSYREGDAIARKVSPAALESNSSRLHSTTDIGSNASVSSTGVPRHDRKDSNGPPTYLSDKENADVDDGIRSARTRSPESVVTTASLDSSTLGSRPSAGFNSRPLQNNMPRTSSIDSAISSASTSSQQRKELGDRRDLSPSTIRGLIATAGSAENLVLHLLKEKNHAASQNTQLWKLVEKQRALLLGLNKDLERVTKEREKYKKKLKEFQSQGALPRDATQSPPRLSSRANYANAVKAPEIPVYNNGPVPSTIESSPPEGNSPIDAPGPVIVIPETFTTAQQQPLKRPVLHTQTSGLAQPTFAFTEATPLNEKPSKGFSALRKTAPKPLNLSQSSIEPGFQASMNVVDTTLTTEHEDEDSRGRRKTREEDDKDREKSLIKEQEARSKSKKSQPPAGGEVQTVLAPPPQVVATLPVSPRPQGQTFGNAQNAPQTANTQERLIPLPLRSPGLPASPRPMNQNLMGMAALPASPRAPPPGPLSPRAPKQPIPPPMMSPSPFADPAVIQRQNALARQAAQSSHQQTPQQDRLQIHEPTSSADIPPVYQGLVSSQYPNLLLPPNALPSIQITVASSRLRPPRHSMLGLRTQEDSTVFSLSVYSRSSRNELWRIEKVPAVLPQLDQQLRPRCKDLPKLPDRKLFNGQSPAAVDARRQAVDAYFEDLLDIEMDEPSALVICRFLSTDVLDPTDEPINYPGVNQDSLPQNASLNGKVVKTGYLTKRGKNFGGWKSRYFVLDSPELRYFETPGGPHLGTIRIQNARIGSQKPDDQTSNDSEDQYRHAFLIQEPKKKDSTTYVRHILCAESDADRDQWVTALLHYVNMGGSEHVESPVLGTNTSFSSRPPTSGKERGDEMQSNSPSPTSPASLTDTSINDQIAKGSLISAPMNGAPIQDSSQWGNKNGYAQSSKDKSKVGSLFHFKKSSQEQLTQITRQQDPSRPRVLRHNGYVRAVFGLPLAEAVEFCSPFNIDVQLPAVVYRSIEYLRFRKAENEEGLFRLSGSNIVIKTLKDRFNTEGDVDLVDGDEHYDVHAIASLFKTYLRELPSPLLTRHLHIEFLRVLELESQEEKIAAFNTLVHRLPSVNFHLLRAMSEYLLEVTENASKNKMSTRNMGIVFSPTINVPTPVFSLFLSEFDAIFERQPGSSHAASPLQQDDQKNSAGLSAEDIRSPRRQMFSDLPTPAYNKTNFEPSQQTQNGPTPVHKSSGSGEFGFTPLQPSYETGQYVSNPQDAPRTLAYAPPSTITQTTEGEEQYGSLNRIMVPQEASTDKRRKRESAMMF